MTLVTKNSIFIHLPKTGGSFLRNVLQKFDPSSKDFKAEGWHKKLEKIDLTQYNFSFSIVRHPIKWYESAWKHIHVVRKSGIRWGPRESHPLSDLDKIYEPVFHDFIERVIKEMPGYYSKALAEYIGENYDAVDYVAKTETLYFDACKIMEKLGIEYNQNTVRAMPTFQRNINGMKWLPNQKERILELEKPIIEKFYA